MRRPRPIAAMAAAFLLGGWVGPASAQVGPPRGQATAPGRIDGFAPILPPLPADRDLPEPSTLVENVGQAVAAFEIKVGQGRFLTLRDDLAVAGKPAPFVAIGDPAIADFFQVGPRQIRLIGKRMGTTDFSVTTGSGRNFDFEIRVVADLDVLRAQLRQMFPDASLRLSQVREKVVVEGQARDASQVSRIVSAIETYIRSIQQILVSGQVGDLRVSARGGDPNAATMPAPPGPPGSPEGPSGLAEAGSGAFNPAIGSTSAAPSASPGAIAANQIATNQVQVINLIRVPTSQQVLLKVRVAELNRSAFRQIGADFLAEIPGAGALFGSQIAGSGLSGPLGSTTFPYITSVTPGPNGPIISRQINPRNISIGSQATLYGTFGNGAFNTVLNALRRNNLLKILAEPNLVALNGHQANFLAGGEFPVPSFSGVGAGATGGGGSSSTQFKEFGVRLSFLPIVQDNETIRLTVDPEVSTVDFSIATTLVPGGSPVPGLNKRSSHTTVELRQGETLAIAGLMQLTLDGQTQRIPGLGDLPYIGAFFSNTSGNRIEKELVVTVTPYLVEPMAPGQVPPGPGDEVTAPNDLEFFFMNRIEGRTGIDKRATTAYDDPLHLIRHSIVEKKYLIGPSGYSK